VQLCVDVSGFCVFRVFGEGLEANELFVSEVIFEIVVNVMGFAYVFEKGESAEFCYFCVFFVLRLSCYENCLKKIWPEFRLFKACQKKIRQRSTCKGLETVGGGRTVGYF
jgi:hypothetical protein